MPGPGTYTILPSISDKGKYSLSSYQNSCATVFSPPSSIRFKDEFKHIKVPGPGNYKIDSITGL